MALPTRVSRESGDPFDQMQREFDTMLSRFLGRQQSEFAPYSVDVCEDADHLYVEADLPGFKKEEIDVRLENQTLTISAEHREPERKEEKRDYLLRERSYSRFIRSFTLPSNIDEQNVDAKLDEGVLKITLNKKEEAKPRRIELH